jgi:tetratricopeptide (TPR) repeat protein
MGESEKALAVISEARRRNVPESWHFYYTEARLSADRLATDQALTLLKKTLAFSDCPRDAITPYVVALLQADLTGDELITKLTAWRTEFPSKVFDLTLAIAHADSQNFKSASTIYESILKVDQHSREALVNLGIIQYREFKNYRSAEQNFSRALSLKGSMATTARSMVLGHLAASYLKTGNLAKSALTFAQAYQLDPENRSILAFMARSFRDLKAFKPLSEALLKIRDETPGTGQLYAMLGDTFSEGLGKHDQAIKEYMNAILLEPERSDYYTSMGLAYYRKKDLNKALRVFETATDLDPNDAVARYNQACMLALLKRFDEAINALADALNLDPKLARTAIADADFSNLKNRDSFRSLIKSYSISPDIDVAH